jgi:hypothetical protein
MINYGGAYIYICCKSFYIGMLTKSYVLIGFCLNYEIYVTLYSLRDLLIGFNSTDNLNNKIAFVVLHYTIAY